MQEEDNRNRNRWLVLDCCLPYLSANDIVNLRCTSHDLYQWSFQSKAILSLLQIIRLRKNNIYQYWIECIRLQHISLEDDSVYERLRSYGIGEQFIKSEGVIGDISRDVSRTFPTHILFKEAGDVGQIMLENILRCVSEYFPNIGYCQGMNFVVAVILIALVDSDGNGFSNDPKQKERIFQYVIMESQPKLEKESFTIIISLINILHMEGLWSAGIPELKRFIFILQKYMKISCPDLLTYFEEIGYDVSIIVSKWFITLFAHTLPLSLLFRLWGYIFREKWPGIIRITISLLLYFEKEMVNKDIVELSIMMKDIQETHFQTLSEQNQLFSIMISLNNINEETFQEYSNQYDSETNHISMLMSDYIPTVDKQEKMKKRMKITENIDSIRVKLESISEKEYVVKQQYHKQLNELNELNEEINELKEFKQNLLQQVESLIYMDHNNVFDTSLNDDEMMKNSFIRQQDTNILCNKIKTITNNIKSKQKVVDKKQNEMNAVKKKWEGILWEKNMLKEELMEIVKQQTNLMVLLFDSLI